MSAWASVRLMESSTGSGVGLEPGEHLLAEVWAEVEASQPPLSQVWVEIEPSQWAGVRMRLGLEPAGAAPVVTEPAPPEQPGVGEVEPERRLRLRRANRAEVIPVPARLEDLIPVDHPARLIWAAVEQWDLRAFAVHLKSL